MSVLAMVSILASAGIFITSNINKSVKEQKLKSEVATLNSAVASYLGFGGNLDGLKSPEEALAKLRSVAASDMIDRIPGLSSSMVDPRIAAVVQTKEQANSAEPRVVWNPSNQSFEIATSGTAGISSFFLNSEDAEITKSEDNRNFAFLYAQSDGWVWDYTETSASVTTGPTPITTYNPITIVNNPTPVAAQNTDDENSNDPILSLLPPEVSYAGGSYSIRDYDLGVMLFNPNPSGSSDLYYQINYGRWNRFDSGSVIEIQPETTLTIQAIGTSSSWLDSSRPIYSYNVTPANLNAPEIVQSSSRFGVFTNRLISVTLENTNSDDPGIMQYRIEDEPWTDYEEMFLLERLDYEDGVVVEARTLSHHPYYQTSNIASSSISTEPLELSGAAEGHFHDPEGGRRMRTNLSSKHPTNDHFEWGSASRSYLSKSTMDFAGLENDNIHLGNRFLLGDLDYYNGRFSSGTGADQVNLAIDLAFDISGAAFTTSFDYEFELINTVNDKNNLYGWASADYVRLDQSNSSTFFEIDGLTFELVLEFGESVSPGFATFDEFHVKEESTASSSLYATLFDRSKAVTPSSSNTGNSNGKNDDDKKNKN